MSGGHDDRGERNLRAAEGLDQEFCDLVECLADLWPEYEARVLRHRGAASVKTLSGMVAPVTGEHLIAGLRNIAAVGALRTGP